MLKEPTERFSTRVANYVKYRPHYPTAVLDVLRTECGLSSSSVVADVGSGTGISASLLLSSGATVYAIEPNAEMRLAAEAWLGSTPGFVSVDGKAEETGLASGSVDLVVAGQAFHWFDREPTQAEFRRILRPSGWVALVWNERLSSGSVFLEGYERLLFEHMPEYIEVNHKEVARKDLASFFRDREMRVAKFANSQLFDFEGLLGRVLSSSYAPELGDEAHEPMVSALRGLFDASACEGQVAFLYETQVFFGRV